MEFLPKEKAQQLSQLAATARLNLSKLAGAEVDYNAEGLAMLDEWIDRHIQQYPNPSAELNMIWGAFLGEAILRKYNGAWGVDRTQGAPLGIICTNQNERTCFIDVQAQIQRRITSGIKASLVYYYTMKGIELNML